MATVNVGDLSREELEEIVLSQSVQLHTLLEANKSLKADLEKSEGEYETLATVILQARQVLSC